MNDISFVRSREVTCINIYPFNHCHIFAMYWFNFFLFLLIISSSWIFVEGSYWSTHIVWDLFPNEILFPKNNPLDFSFVRRLYIISTGNFLSPWQRERLNLSMALYGWYALLLHVFTPVLMSIFLRSVFINSKTLNIYLLNIDAANVL